MQNGTLLLMLLAIVTAGAWTGFCLCLAAKIADERIDRLRAKRDEDEAKRDRKEIINTVL